MAIQITDHALAQGQLEDFNKKNKQQLGEILDGYREKLKSLVGIYDRAVDLCSDMRLAPKLKTESAELRSIIIERHFQDKQNLKNIIKELEADIDTIISSADKLTRVIALLT